MLPLPSATPKMQEEETGCRERHDDLEAKEVDRPHPVGVAGQGEAALGPADALPRREARPDAGHAGA